MSNHGVHKNPSISWHPDDSTLKPWIKAEAGRRGITDKAVLEEMAAEYREKVEFARSVNVRSANREISTALNSAPQATETDGETKWKA